MRGPTLCSTPLFLGSALFLDPNPFASASISASDSLRGGGWSASLRLMSLPFGDKFAIARIKKPSGTTVSPDALRITSAASRWLRTGQAASGTPQWVNHDLSIGENGLMASRKYCQWRLLPTCTHNIQQSIHLGEHPARAETRAGGPLSIKSKCVPAASPFVFF